MSRRVDRQLRGRAGRQGDVGSSQFFVSLEDKLMRLFNSERIARLHQAIPYSILSIELPAQAQNSNDRI